MARNARPASPAAASRVRVLPSSDRFSPAAPAHPVEKVAARLELSADTVRIEVEDPGCGGSIASRSPDLGAGRGGFGLNLVQALSDRWGIERSAKGPTRFWAEIA